MADLGLRAAAEGTSRLEEMVSRAAEALGLSRSALYRRLQRYGL